MSQDMMEFGRLFEYMQHKIHMINTQKRYRERKIINIPMEYIDFIVFDKSHDPDYLRWCFEMHIYYPFCCFSIKIDAIHDMNEYEVVSMLTVVFHHYVSHTQSTRQIFFEFCMLCNGISAEAWLVLNCVWGGSIFTIPDSQVHGANVGPTWVLSAPDGPHVGPMNLAIRNALH